jgi:hypothetical protein
MLVGNVGVEILEWLRADFANQEGLKVDFKAARGDAKSEEGRKFILAGRMVNEPASKTMCTLSIANVLPLPRLRAFWAAFMSVNLEVVRELNRQARAAAVAIPTERGDSNKQHFLSHPVDSWFGSSGELCVTRAEGNWAEAVHQDGGASVVHCGITLYGDRRLVCEQPDLSSVVLRNSPGTVYLGGLTGPVHGVTHLPSAADQLLDGENSATVMLRTTLFPNHHSRVRGTTPSPQGFFFAIAASFVDSFARLPWQLPSLEECAAEFDRAAVVVPAEPEPSPKTRQAKAKATATKKVAVEEGPAKRAKK